MWINISHLFINRSKLAKPSSFSSFIKQCYSYPEKKKPCIQTLTGHKGF